MLVLSGLLLFANAAFAQNPRPLPVIVIDARGAIARLGTDQTTATGLGVDVNRLPGRGLGGSVGVHLYPLRGTKISLGIGGEGLLARARFQPKDVEGQPAGLAIERRLFSYAGTISINFGDRDGWSYLSAGMGPLRFESFTGDLPAAEAPPTKMTQNFGGGARWFVNRHLGACFDVRYYLTRPEVATGTSPARDRKRVMVIAIGISLQ